MLNLYEHTIQIAVFQWPHCVTFRSRLYWKHGNDVDYINKVFFPVFIHCIFFVVGKAVPFLADLVIVILGFSFHQEISWSDSHWIRVSCYNVKVYKTSVVLWIKSGCHWGNQIGFLQVRVYCKKTGLPPSISGDMVISCSLIAVAKLT